MSKHKMSKGREFTGAYDMNGKKIHVGDFLEYCNIAPITSIIYRSIVKKQGNKYTFVMEGGRVPLIVGEQTPYTINRGNIDHVDQKYLKSNSPYDNVHLD